MSSSSSPTSTLVVTNIDQSYSDEDVRKLFKDSQGYLQTKVQYNGGQMFGVVDFKVRLGRVSYRAVTWDLM